MHQPRAVQAGHTGRLPAFRQDARKQLPIYRWSTCCCTGSARAFRMAWQPQEAARYKVECMQVTDLLVPSKGSPACHSSPAAAQPPHEPGALPGTRQRLPTAGGRLWPAWPGCRAAPAPPLLPRPQQVREDRWQPGWQRLCWRGLCCCRPRSLTRRPLWSAGWLLGLRETAQQPAGG